MFESVKIDIDDKKFLTQLGLYSKRMPAISKKMMSKVALKIKQDTKTNKLKGQVLKKGEGTLAQSIKYKSKGEWTTYITASAPYASVHENGAEIEAKEAKYLTFKIGEEWKKVKSVSIPKREFLIPVINDYFNTSKADTIMESTFEKELKKLFPEETK